VKKFWNDGSDPALWVKGTLVVFFIGALLLSMRNAAPAVSRERPYGGAVFLLLPSEANTRADIARWSEIYRPSAVFGYNSPGLFTMLFPARVRETLPPVFAERPVSVFVPRLELPAYEGLSPQTVSPARNFALPQISVRISAGKLPPGGTEVYDESGAVRLRLPGLPESFGFAPLLLRAERDLSGTAFRIVSGSGDAKFDQAVRNTLEDRARRGGAFSGILTVWPGGKELK